MSFDHLGEQPTETTRLADRRRRRMRRLTAVAATGVVAAIAGVLIASFSGDDQPTDPIAAETDDPANVATPTPPERDETLNPTSTPGDAAETPEAIVSGFLDDLRRGDTDAAAQRWSGYPDAGADPATRDKTPFVEALLADPRFLRVLEAGTETFVNDSWSWTDASHVVTVLAPSHGADPPVAVAFLVGDSPFHDDAETMQINRLPSPHDPAAPIIVGSVAEAGQQIVIPGIPVEGGARAYLNGREVEVTVNHEDFAMAITVPGDAEGDVALTLSVATPELPSADAYGLTVLAE